MKILFGIIICFLLVQCTKEDTGCEVCTQINYWKTVNSDTILISEPITKIALVTCSEEEREAFAINDGIKSTSEYSWGYLQLIQKTTCE